MKMLLSLLLIISSVKTIFSQSVNENRDKLYEQLKQAKTPAKQVAAWRSIGQSFGYEGNQDSFKYASEQILKIAVSSHQDSLVPIAYWSISGYFSNTGDYKQAIELLLKSLALAEKMKRPAMMCFSAKDLGVCFKELKNYNEALRYLKKAEYYLKANTFASSMIAATRIYSNMAELYLNLQQTDSALRYVQLANEVSSKEKDAFGYAKVLYVFATIYKAKGDVDLAESYFKKCISVSAAENIYAPYVLASIDYGQYLLDIGQFNLSKDYALNGFRKAKESKDKLLMINAATLLRKAYYAIGQNDSSYYYTTLKDAYTDSVFNEQMRNQVQNLTFAQQIKEKEEQMSVFEEDMQRKQNLQYAIIALSIIVLIGLYLLLSRSFITNTKIIEYFGVVALLIVFEFLNLLLHPLLEKITHHSPILMLLALVCIAALLVPLHHKAEHWATKKLVEKNKAIRLANAKKTIEELESPDKTTT